MKRPDRATIARWLVLLAMVVSSGWSVKHLYLYRVRFAGGDNDANLAQLARRAKEKKVRETLGIYHLLVKHVRGGKVEVPAKMHREARRLATISDLEVTRTKRKLTISKAHYAQLRPTAEYERPWIGRKTLFLFGTPADSYVLAEVGDGSMVWLPAARYESLRSTP